MTKRNPALTFEDSSANSGELPQLSISSNRFANALMKSTSREAAKTVRQSKIGCRPKPRFCR